jgi:hypothetical protein
MMAWPLTVLFALAAIALIAAAPYVVYDAIAGHVGSRVALWIALAIGAAMLIALASAWVLMRARRNAARDRAHGLEPT